MIILILGIIILSCIIARVYTHAYKRKGEILPLLCVIVFVLINKLMRVTLGATLIETILISVLYLSLLAVVIKFLICKK